MVQSERDDVRGNLTHGSPPVNQRRWPAAAGALLVGAAVTAWGCARPRRVVVEGSSMAPTLVAGDRLLVVRSRRVEVGQVVAVRDPWDHGRVLVKRIAAINDGDLVLRGDNQSASTDSRRFGPVPRSAVVGRVIRCYAPAVHAGPIRSVWPA